MSKEAIKKYMFFLLFLIATVSVQAQDLGKVKKWKLNIGYSKYEINKNYKPEEILLKFYRPFFKVDLDYRFFNCLDIGGVLGYSPFLVMKLDGNSNHGNVKRFAYGLNTKYHILTNMINSPDFRIDLYVLARLDRNISFYSDTNTKSGDWNYGIYAGSAFYFGKYWGIFGEYGYGNNTDFNFGLSFKF